MNRGGGLGCIFCFFPPDNSNRIEARIIEFGARHSGLAMILSPKIKGQGDGAMENEFACVVCVVCYV